MKGKFPMEVLVRHDLSEGTLYKDIVHDGGIDRRHKLYGDGASLDWLMLHADDLFYSEADEVILEAGKEKVELIYRKEGDGKAFVKRYPGLPDHPMKIVRYWLDLPPRYLRRRDKGPDRRIELDPDTIAIHKRRIEEYFKESTESVDST